VNANQLFQKRINYQGDLKPILQQVCNDFNLGVYQSFQIIPIGYEDFNLKLTTNKGCFFVKIFAASRNAEDCQRYVKIINQTLENGVSEPKIYKHGQEFLYEIDNDKLIVMEYIEGKSFYELQTIPTNEEIKFIVKQAALINKTEFKPSFTYDHWAITSFKKEYEEKGKYLSEADNKLIKPLVDVFASLNIKDLPYSLVHGDITKTNVIKNTANKIYILDFAVANWYPRIQELAVLLCDLFFDQKQTQNFSETYDFVLSEYQKYLQLAPEEIKLLPTFVRFAHSMHVLLANYEKVVNKNSSVENEYFLNIGRVGLKYTTELWR
jgi:Ser/Thr protein kinase RdoA (MazF antagonist)